MPLPNLRARRALGWGKLFSAVPLRIKQVGLPTTRMKSWDSVDDILDDIVDEVLKSVDDIDSWQTETKDTCEGVSPFFFFCPVFSVIFTPFHFDYEQQTGPLFYAGYDILLPL